MDSEKKFVGAWWMWILGLVVVTAIVLAGLNAAGVFGRTVLERKVFENSYQKQEADKTARTTYDAQLTQLRGRLSNPNLDEGTRAEIQVQIDAINVMKSTKGD